MHSEADPSIVRQILLLLFRVNQSHKLFSFRGFIQPFREQYALALLQVSTECPNLPLRLHNFCSIPILVDCIF